ncbi:hypothetical protein BS47DRAFT_1388544 [Hydnum rufescens UP504]|uniref:Uncharacterized protein n=1 Tax=Hydnum rufescens UP504 TaxID=1448309 RepID=A0A9P6B9S5_9AGAM|nr:hypothetical protein BS47DRAFT_1388544 [Hydnum rufescens UP504]
MSDQLIRLKDSVSLHLSILPFPLIPSLLTRTEMYEDDPHLPHPQPRVPDALPNLAYVFFTRLRPRLSPRSYLSSCLAGVSPTLTRRPPLRVISPRLISLVAARTPFLPSTIDSHSLTIIAPGLPPAAIRVIYSWLFLSAAHRELIPVLHLSDPHHISGLSGRVPSKARSSCLQQYESSGVSRLQALEEVQVGSLEQSGSPIVSLSYVSHRAHSLRSEPHTSPTLAFKLPLSCSLLCPAVFPFLVFPDYGKLSSTFCFSSLLSVFL